MESRDSMLMKHSIWTDDDSFVMSSFSEASPGQVDVGESFVSLSSQAILAQPLEESHPFLSEEEMQKFR